jgi:two-component system NarL family sensor kinase
MRVVLPALRRLPWTTVVGWAAFAVSLAWAVYELAYDDPASWTVPEAGDDAKFALFYEHLIRVLAYTGLGALILTAQPRNKAGMLCLSPVSTPIIWFIPPDAFPTRAYDVITVANGTLAYVVPFAILPLFLPNGRLPNPVWRLVLWSTTMVIIVLDACILASWWGHPVSEGLFELLGRAEEFGMYAALLSLLHRLMMSRRVERVRVAWVLVATWAAFLGRSGGLYLPFFLEDLSWFALYLSRVVGLAIFVVACGLAILWHDLVVLNPLLRRILLAVVLVTVLAGGYLGLQALLGTEPVPAAVSAVGLALVSPLLYRWLRGGVNRVVYGRRGSPADITAALIRRLAAASGPADVLGGLVESAYGAVPSIAVDAVLTSDRGELLRVSRGGPDAVGVSESIPLGFQGTCLGRVEIVSGHPLDPMDRVLLTDLAVAAAAPVAAAHRSAELQRARQELITAREQERRRIARDLHDGVGPVLSGLGFILDSLRASLTDPNAQRVGARARGQVREASQLVRRVARELRPAGIDQLGFLGAVRELAAVHTGPGLTVHVTVRKPIGSCGGTPHMIQGEPPSGPGACRPDPCNADGVLGELCAATEVAAYAIVAEALTNTARHAHATRCDITLAQVDRAIVITVTDNGRGLQGTPSGVGRVSMAERAEELGGWCTMSSQSDGVGTRVTAHLPLPADTTKDGSPSMGTAASSLVGAAFGGDDQ